MRRRTLRLLVLSVVVGVAALGARVDAKAAPTAIGTGGAAATVDALATQAAVDTLRRGGNAVDAAVAAAGVLGVTEPFSCGIGGGGFMVLRARNDGKVTTIDGRETAPAAMRPDSFWENGAPLPFNDARYSGLSVGVPGHRRDVGRSAQALRHDLARESPRAGDPRRAERLRRRPDVLRPDTGQRRLVRRHPRVRGALPRPGRHSARRRHRLPQPGSRTTRTSGSPTAGSKAFYKGDIADALVETVQTRPSSPTANHVWRPGLMTLRDLHKYKAPERQPTHITYRGLDVYGMGPPSSGGSTVGEALNILEGYALSGMTREAALHRYIEASRYSFADRGAYLADPAYFDVPLQGLLSDGFAATRRALITRPPRAARSRRAIPIRSTAMAAEPDKPPRRETRAGTTTHITTADRWGNVVAYTFTIESTGGAGLVVPGYGFLAEQRAHGLQLRLADPPEPGRRREASAQLDEPDDRPSARQAAAVRRLAGRIDDHHDRPPDPGRPARPRPDAPRGDRRPAASQRNTTTTQAEPAFLRPPRRRAAGARARVQLGARDRRRHRSRVPGRRRVPRRSRARSPRRRERDGRQAQPIAASARSEHWVCHYGVAVIPD